MTLQELREEVDKLIPIFQAAKFGDQDFQYIHSIKHSLPIVYDTYYLFIERIYHSTTVALIFDLSKLFYKAEDTSFKKLKDKMLNNYQDSELNNHFALDDLISLFNPIDSQEIETILKNMRTIRDKYYAHLDNKRPNFNEITIYQTDTNLLVSIAENILHAIELKYFGADWDYSLSVQELGHNIFETLNEWEIYREKYGFLNDDIVFT